MKGSEKFKTRIEDFLKEKSLSDTAFAPMLEKISKNIDSCLAYIFGEVRKTGQCAFDDSEIFDMAIKYYTDDTIGIPPEIKCRVEVREPSQPDLFSAPIPSAPAGEVKPLVKETPKTAQTTLTLFDL